MAECNSSSSSSSSIISSYRTKSRLFGDCALVEIIHLHDCLRRSLEQIQGEVELLQNAASPISTLAVGEKKCGGQSEDQKRIDDSELKASPSESAISNTELQSFDLGLCADLAASISSRFHLIWSVFQAHSGAEDEFIWPALKRKVGSQKKKECTDESASSSTSSASKETETKAASSCTPTPKCGCEASLEQQEYEDDHAMEENMFRQINTTLRYLKGAFRYYDHHDKQQHKTTITSTATATTTTTTTTITTTTPQTRSASAGLSQQSTTHATSSNPLSNNSQIKHARSTSSSSLTPESSTAQSIRVHNSPSTPSLKENGVDANKNNPLSIIRKIISQLKQQTDSLTHHLQEHLAKEETQCLPVVRKHLSNEEISSLVGNIMGKRSAEVMTKILKLAVCSLPADERIDMVQNMKNAMEGTFFERWLTMGGWEDVARASVQDRPDQKEDIASDQCEDDDDDDDNDLDDYAHDDDDDDDDGGKCKLADCCQYDQINTPPRSSDNPASRKRKYSYVKPSECMDGGNLSKKSSSSTDSRGSQLRYPSKYYKTDKYGKVKLLWSMCAGKNPPKCVPQFTQVELTPSYHFSEVMGKLVLGCDHYARKCKLRHPKTGQLFTCRLCCEEVRENNRCDNDVLPILDRHEVNEVLCMTCFSVQPAGAKCINIQCESKGQAYAKYFCGICNLYDDNPKKNIYHCPYCNVCRNGKGLGIDFRHCMRCNACVGIAEFDRHKCIPQRLSGNCPICHEALFESTEDIRGMSCGHVMHLSCFKLYAARGSLGIVTCPLCKEVLEDV